ncbi:MAG TPA: OmpA family protein [Anaeromyxobacteraceae bacterium]
MRRLALLAALALSSGATADDPARRGFDVDPSRPAVLADGAFAVESAAAAGRGSARMELLLDYARGLLALRTGDTRAGDLIRDRLALHALGSYALGPVELGFDLPLALHQGSDLSLLTSRGVTGPLVDPIASTAFGDLRLVGKTPLPRFLPLDLAVALDVRLPTGDGSAFLSDGLAVNPQLLAGRALGPVRLDASVGYLFRKSGQYLQLVAGDGVTYGLAASTRLPPIGQLTWRAIADLSGQLPRALDLGSARARAPLSLRAGVRASVWRDLALDVGAGTGLAWVGDAGYGRESFRVFAGLRWERLAPTGAAASGAPGDRDGDGIPDDQDRCPDQPGPAELEGCPDRDGDGIPDIDDKCPDQPGLPEHDGCPAPQEQPLVQVESTHLTLRDAITFESGRDALRPEAGPILDEIARALKAHPELRRVRVEGHTDNVGGRGYNLDLSARRARSVVRALVHRGIPAERLESAGYGFERPVASNATALGRGKNRRVELTVLELAPPGAPPRGPKESRVP